MQPLEELSFICLLVKQDLCLIELVERLPALAFKKSSPDQVEEVLIAKSQPLQSQDLAINPELSIPQNPPRKEEVQPFEISCEDDLFMLILGKG